MDFLTIRKLSKGILRRLKKETRKVPGSVGRAVAFHLKTVLGLSPRPVFELPAPYAGKKPITDKLIQQWKRKGMA
jgi:hypothetical protein